MRAPPNINLHARRWLEANGIPLPDPWEPRDIPIRIEQFYPGGRAGFLRDLANPPKRKADIPGRLEIRRARVAAKNRRFRERHPEKLAAIHKRYREDHKREIAQKKHEYHLKHKDKIRAQKRAYYYERKARESDNLH